MQEIAERALASNSPVVGEDAYCNKCGFFGKPDNSVMLGSHKRPRDGVPCNYAAVIYPPTPTDTAGSPIAVKDADERCSTCRETNAAFFCSNGFHAGLHIPTDTADRREAVARLQSLEWTEDGYSLRTPYDGDVDYEGRHVVVGGETVIKFSDSDEGDKARDAIASLIAGPPEGFGAPRIEAVKAALDAAGLLGEADEADAVAFVAKLSNQGFVIASRPGEPA